MNEKGQKNKEISRKKFKKIKKTRQNAGDLHDICTAFFEVEQKKNRRAS